MQKLLVLSLILLAAVAITLTGCNNKNGGGNSASVGNSEECPGGVCPMKTPDPENGEVEENETEDGDTENGEVEENEAGEDNEDSEAGEEEASGCSCCGAIQISFDDGKTYLIEFNADKLDELGLTRMQVIKALMEASGECKNAEELSALVLQIDDKSVKVSDVLTFTEQ
jgi:hypothetical protein